MATAEPIRSREDLEKLMEHFAGAPNYRNYVLIVMGVNTALRIGDLLRVRWSDVYDFDRGVFRTHLVTREEKTGKVNKVAMNGALLGALGKYLPQRRGEYIFAGSRDSTAPISRVQAHRIVKAAAEAAGIGPNISCHSLRKTLGYHAWRAGVAVPVIMDIYNHTSYEVTKRYLGITQDDKDRVFL